MSEDKFTTRYTHGGDEWILAELAEEMSLGVNVRAQAICRELSANRPAGFVDVCCSNASYLVRVDPDRIHPRDAVERMKILEAEVGDAADYHLESRIVEIPILWQDEWTHEVLMKFRDRHQTPDRSDVEFAAEINGFDTVEGFRDAVLGFPFIASMTGFVPGLAWWFQLNPSDRQIEVPKYVRPRTATPERAFSWGGAFAAVYPVAGAGGYQLLGMCATPLVDPACRLPDFRESDTFFRVGDLVRFTLVDRPEYDRIRLEVEEERFRYRQAPVEFVPGRFMADPESVNAEIVGALDAA